jgi:hypothetical protein
LQRRVLSTPPHGLLCETRVWIYHITFICDLGLHVERSAVDICPCWRLLAGCFPFADWILLFCWIVVFDRKKGKSPFWNEISCLTLYLWNKKILKCPWDNDPAKQQNSMQLFNWIPILKRQFFFFYKITL